MTPLECEIIVGSIPAGAISRKGGSIWGMSANTFRRDVHMTARSKGHHEIPKWLLKHFCWDKGKTLWMGSKDTREVKAVVLKDAFRRNDANTSID